MKTILIIEDEEAICENISDILQISGFQTRLAPNGTIGLNMAQSFKPDMILCDIMMKEMDGYEVLKHLKSDNRFLLTPFVFLSARNEHEDIRKGMKLGADDYLVKPFKAKDLLEIVNSQLSKNEKYRSLYQEVYQKIEDQYGNLMVHEINSPLNGILTAVSLLEDFVWKPDPQTSREMIHAIGVSAKRLHRTLSNMIFFRQITENKYQVFMEDIRGANLKPLFHEMQKKYFRFNDLNFDLQIDQFRSDRKLIQTLITELLDNAFKFTMGGDQIQFMITRQDNRVRMVLNYPEKAGFTTENFELHQPYHQFMRERNEQQGLGIGLSLVKEICRLLEAELTYEVLNNQAVYTIVFNNQA